MSTIPEPDGEESRTGVAVVTDSTTYLPAALFERWGIAQVSLYVGWDGEHLPEGEYELDDFYARLRDSPSLPSTSQPSVGGCATAAPAAGSSSTLSYPRRRRPWSPPAKRSSAPSRSSAPRSAPSSAPTSAPACWSAASAAPL